MRLRRILFVGLILTPGFAFAKQSCEADLGAAFTTSVEWEYKPLPKENDADGADVAAMAAMLGYNPIARQLFETKFLDLFSFYGRDEKGEWVKDLLPKSFNQWELSRDSRALLIEKDGKRYLPDMKKLKQDHFAQLFVAVLNARGQFNEDLKLRKIPSRWKDAGPDRLVPDEVSEEWKFGKFVTIEFPLNGKVESEQEFRAYLLHLWKRLGILPATEKERTYALDNAPGHVHWVPNINKVPVEKREAFYRAVKGYWGSQNDRMSVGYVAAQFERGAFSKRGQQMTFDKAVQSFRWLLGALQNYSLTPLTRDTYNLAKTSAEGIYIEDKSKIDPWVDANFTPDMKRTSLGLRSIYDLNKGVERGVVAHPGLESRLSRTSHDNWNSLPTKALDNPEQLEIFLNNADDGPRGLIENPGDLFIRLTALNLDPRLMVDMIEMSKLGEKLDEKVSPVKRAAFRMIPLNDWRNHSAVRYNLSLMSPQRRTAALKKLDNATARWVQRMQEYQRARTDRSYVYVPEWSMNEVEQKFFSINRFFLTGRDSAPDDAGLEWKFGINLHPVRLFQIAVAAELMRFVDASDLVDLLKPPGAG